MPEVRYGKAINRALHDAMATDPAVLLFGEDIAGAGGSFGVTRGLLETFGPQRVRDTPISEATILSAAVGAHGIVQRLADGLAVAQLRHRQALRL